MKTIVGIATPVGFGGVGIVRLSGPSALAIVQQLTATKLTPRHATLATFHGDNFLDQVLCLYFPGPHSFTGEDVVEIQAHGGWHLLNRIMQATRTLGAIPAEPGEFTRTAVLNGKMTLSQAESTIEMINAESDAELQNASLLLSGTLHQILQQVETDLIAARAEIDAYLDYPEDLESPALPLTMIQQTAQTINELLATASTGRLLKNGFNVCLVGCPNAGKSSLFNALVQNNRSIVTDIAGTTTDTIRETITHRGVKINFTDTAGIRANATSAIEQQGIARAKQSLQDADLLLIVVDAVTREVVDFPPEKKHLLVYNKCDLCPTTPPDGLPVSAKQGTNLSQLLDTIAQMATATPAANGVLNLTNERHIHELSQAAALLAEITPTQALDQIAANITAALAHIGKITGSNVDERTLDEIFSKFCLGK